MTRINEYITDMFQILDTLDLDKITNEPMIVEREASTAASIYRVPTEFEWEDYDVMFNIIRHELRARKNDAYAADIVLDILFDAGDTPTCRYGIEFLGVTLSCDSLSMPDPGTVGRRGPAAWKALAKSVIAQYTNSLTHVHALVG